MTDPRPPFRSAHPPRPRPTTPSCRSRSRRSICAAAWCGSGRRSTTSCAATTIRRRSPSCWARRSCSPCCSAPSLKFEGRFILQTQTDGPVRMLVVDFTHARQGARLRALRRRARGGRDRGRQGRRRRAARPRPSRHDHRPGPRHEPLSGPGRARRRRPRGRGARIFPALRADPDARAARGRRGSQRRRGGAQHRWRAGGMLLQFLPKAPERARSADLDPGDAPEGIDAACRRRRTTPGSKAARWSRPSRTSS